MLMNYTIGEMFCGPGGIAVGASDVKLEINDVIHKFKHKWATDYHPDTCSTYRNNISRFDPEVNVICSDVRLLDIDSLPPVDGFLYGFPCNDFSNVGESKGLNGEFGPLYSFGVEYIRKNNPKFFFAENVSGITNSNEGEAFKLIYDSLSKAGYGYTITPHLYKFEEYGVPQARHRMILIGIRNDLNLTYRVPKPLCVIRSSKEAITIPPISKNVPNQELTRQSQQVIERLSYIKPGQNAWTADIPKHLQLNVKGAKMSMIYKKLDPNKPAYTVTGSGGGGTHMYHWSENRALTNRERARLQTFPDTFEFFGSKESVRRQIGMAVPPLGAKIILEAVIKTLNGIDYEYVHHNQII
mgnify:CR=1 FL=1